MLRKIQEDLKFIFRLGYWEKSLITIKKQKRQTLRRGECLISMGTIFLNSNVQFSVRNTHTYTHVVKSTTKGVLGKASHTL